MRGVFLDIQGLSGFLIKADQICDSVPVLSTVNNVVDLFIKIVVLPQMRSEEIKASRYHTRLDKKTFTRCALFLIPILGQILVYIGDILPDNKTFALELVKINGLHLRTLRKRLRNDKDVVLAAVLNNPEAIEYARDDACYDEDVMRVVAGQNYKPPVSDREQVLKAVTNDPMAITDFSEFWDDREIMLIAVKGYGRLFVFCSDGLKDDDEVFLTAVVKNPRALDSASERIKDSKEIVLEAFRRTHEQSGAWVLQFATKKVLKVLLKDPEILQAYKAGSR